MTIGKTQTHTHTHTQAGEKKRLARCLPVCLPFVDIFNHTQNVKEQQFTLNDTRRRAVDAAACPRVMQLANSNSGAGIQATRQSGSQAVSLLDANPGGLCFCRCHFSIICYQ